MHRRFSFLFLLVFAIALPVSAQDADLASDLQGELDHFAQAWARGDVDTAMDGYLADASYMGADGPIGMDALAARYQDMVNGAYAGTRLAEDEVHIRQLGEDFALMTARYSLYSPEDDLVATGWFTLIWQKTDAGWKILHDHSS